MKWRQWLALTALMLLIFACPSADAENHTFTIQPVTGALNATTQKYPITWETSFLPTKVEVLKGTLLPHSYGYAYEYEVFDTITSGLNLQGSFAIPASEGGNHFQLLAYYGDTSHVSSEPFDLEPTNPRFINEPVTGALNATTQKYPITWETSFLPTKVEVLKGTLLPHSYGYAYEYEVFDTITSGLNLQGSFTIPASEGGNHFQLLAYYGDTSHVSSEPFDLEPTNPRFINDPVTGALNTATQKYPITWETSFLPTKVEVLKGTLLPHSYGYAYEYEVFDTITSGLNLQGSFTIPASEGGNHFQLLAYYGDTSHVSSEPFDLGPTNPRFINEPVVGGLSTANHMVTVTWDTSFVPIKIEVMRCEGSLSGGLIGGTVYYNPVETIATITGSSTGHGSWSTSVSNAGKHFMIRAYYGADHSEWSNDFSLPDYYGVIYNMQGHGNPISWQQLEYHGIPTRPADPSETGWRFDGWYTSSDYTEAFDFTAPVTGVVVVHAKWTRLYTVSFEMNGHGQPLASQSVAVGTCVERPQNPTEANAIFGGWYADAQLTHLFSFASPIIADTVIYAKWITCYYVYFDSRNGSGTMRGVQVSINGVFILPTPTFTPPVGAAFAGWQKNGTGDLLAPGTWVTITGAVTYYATWTGPYNAVFQPNDGTGEMDTQRIGHGESFILPQCGFTPPAGKAFSNWRVVGENSNQTLWPGFALTMYENVTISPIWRIAHATFQADGGTGILPEDELPDSSGYITLPPCSLMPPEGKTFMGWSLGQPGQRVPIYGDTVVTPVWQDSILTLTFSLNGATGDTFMTTLFGTHYYTLPTAEEWMAWNRVTPPAGKVFLYWHVPAAVTNYKAFYPGETVHVITSCTIYPVWIIAPPSTVTVSFAPGDGSGSMPSLTVPYNQPFVLPECSFTPPEGCVFSYWNFNSGYHYPGEETTLTADTTVTALYRQIEQYTVLFDTKWHGTAPASQTVTEGGYVTDPGPLSVPGYTFNGWRISYTVYEDGDYHFEDIPFDFSQPIDVYAELVNASNREINIFADWTENRYIVTVNALEGGTASIRNDQDDWQYGSAIYVEWDTEEGWYLDRILMIPEIGEPVDVTYPEFKQPNFTVPDCNVVVEVRFINLNTHQGGAFGDELYWDLNAWGNLTIGGVGAMPDFTWENEAPWMPWKDEISSVEIQPGITTVGKLAFAEITGLGYASLPGTVTRIGSMAFYCCNSLNGVQLPDGLTILGDSAFEDTAITSVDIPAGVRVLDESTFAGCVNLSSVSLHEGLQVIGDSAFGYCASLTEISIPQSVTQIGTYAFDNCTLLQRVSGLEHVGQLPGGLFCECNSLTDIGSLPRISVISGDTFARCRSLTSIAIPSTVTQIEDWAFDECDSLTAVYYEGSRAMWNAIQIGDHNDGLVHATIYCKPVVSFETNCDAVIPDQLINYGKCPTIPETPFVAGSQFTGWYLESSLDNYYDFSDPLYEDTVLYAEWYTPDPRYTLRLPNMLTVIESEAFAGVNAYAVVVPRGVTSIADDAFPPRMEYVLGFPGTYAQTWANTHGMAFIEIDDGWLASH